MERQTVTERIYQAFKKAAGDHPMVAINRAIDYAAVAVGIMPGLVRRYLQPMVTVGWIDNDGYTLWLSRDYGERQKISRKHVELKRARQILRAARRRKRK